MDFSELKPVKTSAGTAFTAMQNEGEIKIANFATGASQNKLISTVSDSEFIIEDNQRFKYLATYIGEKNEIVGIKLSQYKKNDGELIEEKFIILKFKQAGVLTDFIKFLSEADLGTLTSGNFVLADSLNIDPDLYSKLITLSSDKNGKEALIKLFESGYLTIDLDIPELIKKGLSQAKIDEKLDAINKFEELINKPDVKEVSEIQAELSKMPWILGPEYEALDVRGAGDSGIPDRRLKRIDGLSDILEVKLPNVELLRKDATGRHYISPDLSEALGQLTGYLEHYYSAYSTEKNDETEEEVLVDNYGKYYKPKGILLIGRRITPEGVGTQKTDNAYPKYLRRLLSYFHWVEVLTYDDLIERARNGLLNLTK
ncbi:DUF4263 domain-containing protein [Candidatus Microgenomates bacterium]|nr:DUF4263 domain-containing protein [Candidatus Microgenomates bacterium]